MNRRAFVQRLATTAAVASAAGLTAMAADIPDPVFALAQERDAIMLEYSVPDLDDAVMDVLEARLSSVESRIAAAQCSTSAAIAEKLRIALGADAFSDKPTERIVASALADLLRIGGGISHGDRS